LDKHAHAPTLNKQTNNQNIININSIPEGMQDEPISTRGLLIQINSQINEAVETCERARDRGC